MENRLHAQFMLAIPQQTKLELAVIIPTFNEAANVEELLNRLTVALCDTVWEAIFVDDNSTDRTADIVRKFALSTPYIRIIQRIGRRGLSSAVIEGMLATSAPYFAVIDADLQHDERLLPNMLSFARSEGYDLVVASRYMEGGSAEGLNGESRYLSSRLGTRLTALVLTDRLSDPMSGFFLVSRSPFENVVRDLSGLGFKILLDIVSSSPKSLRILELPYKFRERYAGDSKLDSAVLWQFVIMLLDKKFGRIVPAKFILFAMVGTLGLLVHLASLWVCLKLIEVPFVMSQTTATIVAMTSNYLLNNSVTHRDKRRTGVKFFTGLLSFYAVCAIGAVANVGVAEIIYRGNSIWWISGLAGALVGSVWNYALSALVTWKK